MSAQDEQRQYPLYVDEFRYLHSLTRQLAEGALSHRAKPDTRALHRVRDHRRADGDLAIGWNFTQRAYGVAVSNALHTSANRPHG